jgi:hypothetical protein
MQRTVARHWSGVGLVWLDEEQRTERLQLRREPHAWERAEWSRCSMVEEGDRGVSCVARDRVRRPASMVLMMSKLIMATQAKQLPSDYGNVSH